MKRNAFTMIELVFVIVILGILSAVALPKIMASKDDAQVVAETTNAKQNIKNAAAEFLSQGAYVSNYPDTKCYSFTAQEDGDFIVSQINEATDLCTKVHSSDFAQGLEDTYKNGGLKIKF